MAKIPRVPVENQITTLIVVKIAIKCKLHLLKWHVSITALIITIRTIINYIIVIIVVIVTIILNKNSHNKILFELSQSHFGRNWV